MQITWLDDAQALVMPKLEPEIPKSMLIWLVAALGISFGMLKGCKRLAVSL